jgi:hypothetical protein
MINLLEEALSQFFYGNLTPSFICRCHHPGPEDTGSESVEHKIAKLTADFVDAGDSAVRTLSNDCALLSCIVSRGMYLVLTAEVTERAREMLQE